MIVSYFMKTRINSKQAGRRKKEQNPRFTFLSEVMEDRWEPPVDVAETPESIVVVAELAGVKPGDVQVDIEGRDFRLRGIRNVPEPTDVFPSEISEGAFERKLTLPADVDPLRKTVTLREGLLRVEIPKLP